MTKWRSNSQCKEASLPLATHETGIIHRLVPLNKTVLLRFNAAGSSQSTLELGSKPQKQHFVAGVCHSKRLIVDVMV